MKSVLFSVLLLATSAVAFGQLDVVKPAPKPKPKPAKTTPPKKTNSETQPSSSSSSSSGGGSYIIVYRGGKLASSLVNYSIYIDGRKVCILSNERYFRYPVSAGKHEIEAKKSGVDINNKEFYTSVVSNPGQNKYVEVNIKTGLLKSKVEFNDVEESIGKHNISGMKEDNCQGDINESRKQ
ncbi:MAG: hypothetical protein JST86_13550 [Bacteroidetes bacterium]|nr:hypothetical protein [Bacteroidota bacterium]